MSAPRRPPAPSSSPATGTSPVLAGVAGDLADRLGIDPVAVRIAFVVLTAAGGAGVLLYALLWLRLARSATGSTAVRSASSAADVTAKAGLALAFVGLLLLLRAVGLWFGDAVVLPVVLGGAGSLLIWTRADDRDRARLGRTLRLPPPVRSLLEDVGRGIGARSDVPALTASPLRLVGGALLIALAMFGLLVANDALVAARQLLVVGLVAAVGLVLLFGPWALRLVEAASSERRARIREEERGEIAAHLHDSVLQSLALIQRAGDDPQRMVAIARRQERELRRWLFEGRADEDASTLAGALDAAVGTLEAAHGIHVELVRVGDAPLTPSLTALVAAVREAVGNAARHAGVDAVAVFVEVTDEEVVAYVLDRGRGFDESSVADDRSGIRHSIRGRLERRGGRALLTTTPGDGAEWELAVPRDGEVSASAATGPTEGEQA
jgi:signal transduction histidine kinase